MNQKNKAVDPEETAQLRRRYTQVPVKDRVGAFGSFESFSAWAYQNGFQMGQSMMRHDPGKPVSPENCYFADKAETRAHTKAERESMRRYTDTVNRIRARLGWAPLGKGDETC